MDKDGSLYYDEYYRKFYEDGELAEWLAPFVEEGSIECVGEDGTMWALQFNGNRKYRIVDGSVVYNDDKWRIPRNE